MDILKKILGFMFTLLFLVLIVGGGLLYYQTQGNPFAHNMTPPTKQENPQENQDNQDNNKKAAQPKILTQQEIAQIQIDFLNQYIDEINDSLKLINEANGLITSDPFFANPPVVGSDNKNQTPFDEPGQNLTPSTDNNNINNADAIILPESYLVFYQENTRNVRRGIYKLAQGMTLLNQAIDRMNTDVGRLKTDPSYLPPRTLPQIMPSSGTLGPWYYPWFNQSFPQMNLPNQTWGNNVSTDQMQGHTMTSGVFGGLNTQTISMGISMLIVVLFFVVFIAIGGYLLSFLNRKPQS